MVHNDDDDVVVEDPGKRHPAMHACRIEEIPKSLIILCYPLLEQPLQLHIDRSNLNISPVHILLAQSTYTRRWDIEDCH